MRAFLLLLLLIAAFPVSGGLMNSYSASGKMDDKHYEFKVSEADILRTPIWKPDADFPPLSARKAQEIARREMQKLLGDGKQEWLLRETTIADMGDGMHFVYVIQFEPPLGVSCMGCDFIRILVLMDGTVPKPIVKSLPS
jgi:hypothetical protein